MRLVNVRFRDTFVDRYASRSQVSHKRGLVRPSERGVSGGRVSGGDRVAPSSEGRSADGLLQKSQLFLLAVKDRFPSGRGPVRGQAAFPGRAIGRRAHGGVKTLRLGGRI